MATANPVTLKIGSSADSRWTDLRATVGLEQCTADFSIGSTSLPGQPIAIPGDHCQLLLDGDQVITGYVNEVLVDVDRTNHRISVSGRGKCQDLVDCSAEWPSLQIANMYTLAIAQKLAQPYSITVAGSQGLLIPQLSVMIGETAWDIIERICRYSQLIPYELPDGSLTLAAVGTTMAGSALGEGQGSERYSMRYCDAQRYSNYESYLLAFDTTGDVVAAMKPPGTATDPNVKRHRLLKIIAQVGDGLTAAQICQRQAIWEANRRAGRAAVLTVTTNSWRDGAGKLWTPNTLVPLNFPSAYLTNVTYLIGKVTFGLKNDGGTTATLELMLPEAFRPEPFILQPIEADINQAIDNSKSGNAP